MIAIYFGSLEVQSPCTPLPHPLMLDLCNKVCPTEIVESLGTAGQVSGICRRSDSCDLTRAHGHMERFEGHWDMKGRVVRNGDGFS